MHDVRIRLRTPKGVHTGTFSVSHTSHMDRVEMPGTALHALEQAVFASGIQVDPFEVVEAVFMLDELTYLYQKQQ